MTSHCNILAAWCHRTNPVVRGFDSNLWELEQHPLKVVRLQSGSVRVTFTTVKDHPDKVRVRATNWRAEDEPYGWYSRANATQLYLLLKSEGYSEL